MISYNYDIMYAEHDVMYDIRIGDTNMDDKNIMISYMLPMISWLI